MEEVSAQEGGGGLGAVQPAAASSADLDGDLGREASSFMAGVATQRHRQGGSCRWGCENTARTQAPAPSAELRALPRPPRLAGLCGRARGQQRTRMAEQIWRRGRQGALEEAG